MKTDRSFHTGLTYLDHHSVNCNGTIGRWPRTAGRNSDLEIEGRIGYAGREVD